MVTYINFNEELIMLKEQRQFIENFIGNYKPHSDVSHFEWSEDDEITLFVNDTGGGVFITPYNLTSIYDLYKLRHHLILSDETKPIVTALDKLIKALKSEPAFEADK